MKYLPVFVILLLISCTGQEPDICLKTGENYIYTETCIVDSCCGGLIIYDTIEDAYAYSFLIGTGMMQFVDNDISKTRMSGEYLRLHLVADAFDPEEVIALSGSYNLLDNGLNTFCYQNESGEKISEPIIYGGVTLLKSCPYTGLLRLEFLGSSANFDTIKAECYIQSMRVAYKLQRDAKGQFIFKDSIYQLSVSDRFHGNFNNTIIEFGDFVGSLRSNVHFDINREAADISGTYHSVYTHTGYVFSGFVDFYYYSDSSSIQEYFVEGDLQITQKDSSYFVLFDLLTNEGNTLQGEWDGSIN